MKFSLICVFLSIVIVMSGCSSVLKMGITAHTMEIDLSKESLILMSIHIKNTNSPYYEPEAREISIETSSGSESTEKISYRFDRYGSAVSAKGNRYFVRAFLKPGKYIIRGVKGQSKKFPFVGTFFMPLHSSIEVPPSSIIYLGKIVGTVRERKDDEFRAGSLFPLIDQAVTGFSTGTFEITMVDAFDDDVKTMTVIFPVLGREKEIKKQLLAPFDREFAQKWWDDH